MQSYNKILFTIERLLSKLRISNAGQHKKLLAFSIILFVSGLAYSVYASQFILSDFRWEYLLIIFIIFMPPTIFINAIRYKLTSSLANNPVNLSTALNVSILSSAANILPLPGGVMVRLANLKAPHNTYSHSIMAIYSTSLLWLSLISIYTGGWLLYFDQYLFGYSLLIPGLGIFLYSSFSINSISNSKLTLMMLIATEIGSIQIDVIRMFLAFAAIGASISYSQSSVFSITSVMGSIISIVPAGLGIRELFAASISVTVDVQPAHGYIAASINRIIGLAFILPISFILIRTIKKK